MASILSFESQRFTHSNQIFWRLIDHRHYNLLRFSAQGKIEEKRFFTLQNDILMSAEIKDIL